MKHTKYLVEFEKGRSVVVFAFGEDEAKILAQAKKIEFGEDYSVTKIKAQQEDKPPWFFVGSF